MFLISTATKKSIKYIKNIAEQLLQNKEGVNNNKDVFFFGYSVGNNYLCKDFSAKAIKDTFQHSVA